MSCGYRTTFDRWDYPKSRWVIWSWSISEPFQSIPVNATSANDFCAYMASDGRWKTSLCSSQSLRFACQDPTGVFSLSPLSGSGSSVPSCVLPLVASAPKTPKQNEQLFKIASGASVWLKLPFAASQALVIAPAPPPPPQISDSGDLGFIPISLGNESTKKDPQSPRFCGMAVDSQEFNCEWLAYGIEVTKRNIGMIVFVALGFIISCLFGLTIILCFCGCIGRKKKKARYDENRTSAVNTKKLWPILVLPILGIAAGAGVVLAGNGSFNVIFGDTSRQLEDRLSYVTATISLVRNSLQQLDSSGVTISADQKQQILDKLDAGVSVYSGNVSSFNTQAASVNTGRSAVIILSAFVPIFLGILGIILVVKRRRQGLIYTQVAINFFVFCTIVSFTLHAALSTVGSDVCSEVDYKNGMFDLWQKTAIDGFKDIQTALNNSVGTVISDACDSFAQLCYGDLTLCGDLPCGVPLLQRISNLTVTDTDTIEKTIKKCGCGCVDQCQSSKLRAGTSQFSSNIILFDSFYSLVNILNNLFTSLASESTRAVLDNTCSGLDESLTYVYTGCGVLLVSDLLLMGGLFYFGWK
eukprot:TRINITY_DN3442_c0_g1_i1.p1 TRINITY_DN3442_c0_g1~~TRINITY_DN3442_c0_g1_i1.p1  ORF type:complete len:583 (+),score=101.80 TRINITY_DN3442_c0_g1_i1:1117-2865(+)